MARRQLETLGLGGGAIDWRIRHGRLHRVRQGVHAVGHRALTQHGHWMAAVLAAGPGAVLSHRPPRPSGGSGRRPVPASTSRSPEPCTRPRPSTRTAPFSPPTRRPTYRRDPTTQPRPDAPRPRRHPHPASTRASDQRDRPPALRERDVDRAPHQRPARHRQPPNPPPQCPPFNPKRARGQVLAFLDRHNLPTPQTNTLIEGKEVDGVWTERKLIVELDSYAFHGTRAAFERDRQSDRRLAAAGWRVLRITDRDLNDRPHEIAAQIQALLSMPPFNPAHPPDHPKSRAPNR